MRQSSNTLHLRCGDRDLVVRAYSTVLRRRGFRARVASGIPHYLETYDEAVFRRVLISEPMNGWITVIDQRFDDQRLRAMDRIGNELTAILECSAVAFVLHDSQVLYVFAWDHGKRLTRWCSWPGWSSDEEITDDVRHRWKGNPARLLPFCRKGFVLEDLDALMRDHSDTVVDEEDGSRLIWPEELLRGFGNAFGIQDGIRTYASFHAKSAGLYLAMPNGEPLRLDSSESADPYWERFTHLHFMRR